MTVKTYPVPESWSSSAWINKEKYNEMYDQSVRDPDGFWREQGARIDWIKPFTKVKNTSFDPHNVSIKWFEDGTLNVCHNCVDRLKNGATRSPSSGKATSPMWISRLHIGNSTSASAALRTCSRRTA